MTSPGSPDPTPAAPPSQESATSAAPGQDSPARFSQRYTAFARSHWDTTCAAYRGDGSDAATEAHRGEPGYGDGDFALQNGAWAVARARLTEGEGEGVAREDADMPADRDGQATTGTDPATLTRQVKDAAALYGADLVGIARVRSEWVYATDERERPIDLPEGVDRAIVVAVSMDYERLKTSPSVLAGAATGNGYSRMAFTSHCLAAYLRDLGWRAIACGNDTALSIPLAVDAGLGQVGRNGLLITPRFGPRVRLCKVFTDAPLVSDAPIRFGVTEFCDLCLKCATTCPSSAITRGPQTEVGPTPSNHPGLRRWFVDPEACLSFWHRNGVSCANCIRSCPFNKAPGKLHDAARALIGWRLRPLDRLLVWLDDRLGYGSARAAKATLARYAE